MSPMARMYVGGATLREVGEAFGLQHTKVRRALLKERIAVRPQGHRPHSDSPAKHTLATALRADKKTFKEIAATMGFKSRSTAWRWANRP